MRFSLVLCVAVAAGAVFVSVPSAADPAAVESPDLQPLLAKLAQHAERFEQMKRRGSYTLSGKVEELDGSGHVDGTKEMVVRVIATPAERKTEIVRYVEDGADKTDEARKKAEKSRQEKKQGKSSDFHLPFLSSEQPKYVFSITERDATRIRVGFRPLVPAETSFKGSAWVDEATGEVLTLGFSPSKNKTFVDHIDVTMRFDHQTPLGRAPSSFTFDAKGGFLVIRKHYRGGGTITDPKLAF
jgi:hypothetical protein